MNFGIDAYSHKQTLLNRRKINLKEKDANAILYGISAEGKTALIKNEIMKTLLEGQDEIYVFTNENCFYEYEEFSNYRNFYLLSHDKILDLSVRESIYKERLNERINPVWVYIDNGNMLSKEQLYHISPMFAIARSYRLIATLNIIEYEKWLDELSYSVSCHVFMEMMYHELERFPIFFMSNDDKQYLKYNNPLNKTNTKVVVKLLEIDKETVTIRTILKAD